MFTSFYDFERHWEVHVISSKSYYSSKDCIIKKKYAKNSLQLRKCMIFVKLINYKCLVVRTWKVNEKNYILAHPLWIVQRGVSISSIYRQYGLSKFSDVLAVYCCFFLICNKKFINYSMIISLQLKYYNKYERHPFIYYC